MWDVLVRTPRGSNNPRKFSMLLATFFVACFGYIFAAAPSVSAVDASWDGDNVVYDGNTYTPLPQGESRPSDMKNDQAAYRYIDDSKDPDLIYFVYFASSVPDPQSEKEATYVRYTLNPPNRYVNPTGKKTLIVTPVTQATSTPAADTDDGAFTDTCTIDGIGWIVCPIMQGLSEGMDFIYERIRGFLEVQPISTSVDNPIYRIWSYSRDIANIAFVIGFLVIIYSYIVGGGFTGYEIRKILPRLVIAAILINLSYVLSSIAVDMSNIAGYGVNQLFETVRDDVLTGSSAGDEVDVNWTSVTAAVLAGGVGTATAAAMLPPAIGGVAAGLWFLLAPFLVGAALLVMVTFFILAARQAIIVVLIAIAPLACAAFILPNTEKWFERWRSVFFTMLIMFPAFGAVFGAAQLAGELIIRSANSIEQIILGLGVMVAPLAVTPLLLKLGGGVLNRFGGVINNAEKGAFDRFKSFNNDRRADFLAKKQHENAQRDRNGNLVNNGFMRRAAYRQDLKKYNRQRLRDANTGAAQALYDDNDHGVETARSKMRRSYANARGRSYDPTYKYGSEEVAGIQHRTELQKNLTHARHDDHWQKELQNTPGLRSMLTDTRTFEGKAAVRTEAMKAEDDRSFQTALNTDAAYVNLRDMKINTSVDAGVADLQKAAIDAAGQREFRQTVEASRALSRVVKDTHHSKKQAEKYEAIVQNAAEKSWNDRVRLDEDTQALYLRSQRYEDGAQLSEQELKTFVQNVRSQGSEAPMVAASSRASAASIKDLVLKTDVSKNAEVAAQSMERIELAKTYRDNEVIRKRAGGIGGDAAASIVYAKAFQTIVKDQNEAVNAEKTVLSRVESDDIFSLMKPEASAEQLSAYAGTIAGRGYHADHIKLLSKASGMYKDAVASGDQDQVDKMRDMLQQIGADQSKIAFGLRDFDRTLLSEGRYDANIFKTTQERILTNISPEVLSTMDPDDINLLYEMHRKNLLTPEQNQKIIDNWDLWENDPILNKKIQTKHRNFFDRIKYGNYSAPIEGMAPPDDNKYGITAADLA